MLKRVCLFFLVYISGLGAAKVQLGVDVFFDQQEYHTIKNKRIGLVINQSSTNSRLESTLDVFKRHAGEYRIVALFSPEHGLSGAGYAGEKIKHSKDKDGVVIYSLYGATRRPTKQMLKNIDVLIFDIQEIGSRSYTYASTLYYIMEEAAKQRIPVIVLDRPNPMNGVTVDGPMLSKEFRSFLGYVNVPYCHGMTIGELARFFNAEYKVGCDLKVIKMRNWQRAMSYKDTGLPWLPTSPYIPEADTPFYYASTGILGELGIVNIGIGYTQPFKIVGAPWIDAHKFAKQLNDQKFPGVKFHPYFFKPFYGVYQNEECQGVKIIISNHTAYRPLAVQYLILGMLKSLYPKKVDSLLSKVDPSKKKLFCQVNGNKEMLDWVSNEKYIVWKLIKFNEEERQQFLKKRDAYLLY
jgi:uncharacterized protein YbbC (DUF1343 family)